MIIYKYPSYQAILSHPTQFNSSLPPFLTLPQALPLPLLVPLPSLPYMPYLYHCLYRPISNIPRYSYPHQLNAIQLVGYPHK